jgi:hypothetical protein
MKSTTIWFLLTILVAPLLVLCTWWILGVAGIPVEREIGRTAVGLAPVLGLLSAWFRGSRFGATLACLLGVLLLPLGEATVFRWTMWLGLSVTTGETLSVLIVLAVAWIVTRRLVRGPQAIARARARR